MDKYFKMAQEKIIAGGDPVSDHAIMIAKEIYEEAQALKPCAHPYNAIKNAGLGIAQCQICGKFWD